MENNLRANKRSLFISLASLIVFAAAAFFCARGLELAGTGTALVISLSLAVFLALAFFALFAGGMRAEGGLLYIMLAAAYALILLRIFCFDNRTGDYNVFLEPWTEHFRQNGGFGALKESIGNYNIPYLVFLALFSYMPISELYLIKLLSVGFDLVLAVSLSKIVLLCTQNSRRSVFCFVIALALPTVFLNGAYWGQCDSIYGALAVLSIYFALGEKPWLSVAALALSFAFKLQAVFVFPLFLVLLFCGKLKIYHLALFPAVYFAAVSPAVIAGRPVVDTLLLYVNQGATVGDALNYSSPSVFSLFYNISDPARAARVGIICAFAFCAVMFALTFYFRKRLKNSALLLTALIFSVAVPLLLPHMHERYFFIADALSLAAAFCLPGISYCAPLASFASLLGYHAYLRGRYFMPMKWGFFALVIVIVSALFMLLALAGDEKPYGEGVRLRE